MDAGMMETFYNNIKSVGMDEKSHEQFLTQALTSTFLPLHYNTSTFTTTELKFPYRGRRKARRPMRILLPFHRRQELPCSR